jgi:hypothetical protein
VTTPFQKVKKIKRSKRHASSVDVIFPDIPLPADFTPLYYMIMSVLGILILNLRDL